MIVIRGDSGSGKSTLLRILGLMDRDYGGEYIFGPHNLRHASASLKEELRSQNIGFVFQEDRLLPHFSLQRNIELPLRIRQQLTVAAKDRLFKAVQRAYSQDELAGKRSSVLFRRPSTLSGGQRQRGSVLRAIAHSPKLLLADEPTANLDPGHKDEVVAQFRAFQGAGGTLVIVSHEHVFDSSADVVYELAEGCLRTVSRMALPAAASANCPAPINSAHAASSQTCTQHGSNADTGTSQPPAPPRTETSHTESGSASLVSNESAGNLEKEIVTSIAPRSSFLLHLEFAVRELFRNRLFTALSVGALAVASVQLTILCSLQSGATAFLDGLIQQGSRLDRITVSRQAGHDDRFPFMDAIRKFAGLEHVIFRHEQIYNIQDINGRFRNEAIFALEKDDPEFDKLTFTAGGRFTSSSAFQVIMSERSIKRLFDIPAEPISADFRRQLIGKQIQLRINRPRKAGAAFNAYARETEMEPMDLIFTIAGIVTRAEGNRNFYLPRVTQLILERWRLDESRLFRLPVSLDRTSWTLSEEALAKLIDFPWEESADLYFANLDQVLTADYNLRSMGYEPRTELLDHKWVLDSRRLSRQAVLFLLALVTVISALVVYGNLHIAVELRAKELVLLKLIGMRTADLALIFLWNATLAAILGTTIGFAIGDLFLRLFRAAIAQRLEPKYAQLIGPVAPFFAIIVVAGILLSLIAGGVPAYRAGLSDPAKEFAK
jgi:putative ABC transport system ATP-binding protein